MAIETMGGAQGVCWNLGDLYKGMDDPKLAGDMDQSLEQAVEFEKKYRNVISSLKPSDALVLLAAVRELEALYEVLDKPAIFASLLHAGKSDEAAHGALVARTREARTKANQHLLFFDLEWIKVEGEIANALVNKPELAAYKHFLEQKRAWKDHYLSEPEEKISDIKGLTGRSAFVRLFDETTSSMTYPLKVGEKEEKVSFQ